jgi:thioredoxin-related protein
MRRVLLIVLFTISLFCTSCHQDETGKWRLDPFAADRIEGTADTTAGVFSLLSLFIPGAAGVAGIAAGIAATFKKMKPGLTKYKNTSQHIVTSVERIKKNQPELWARIKDEFKQGTNTDIETVIGQIVTIQKAQEKNT